MNKLRMFLAVLASVMSIHAFGLEFEVDGIYYSVSSTAMVYGCAPDKQELIIPEKVKYGEYEYTVTSISGSVSREFCIANNKVIKKISIPKSVKTIFYHSFENCTSLEEVVFSPNSTLTSIGTYAFKGCSKLHKIDIPDTVTEIMPSCFKDCSSLKEVNISANSALAKLGSGAFGSCISIREITIPDAVTEISYYCFEKCSALEKVNISEKTALIKFGEGAFNSCSSLKNIIIPDGVTEIPTNCFQNCSALEKVNISSNSALATLGKYAFNKCESLKNINIPDAVTEVLNYCFSGCSTLEEINISSYSALAKLGEGAFYNCSSLKKINMPDAVVEVPDFCFYGCSALEEVNISSNSVLAKLGASAFNSCSCLKKANIPDAMTEILGFCFSGCSALEEVNISSNSALSKIGESAFYGCSSLKKFSIPDTVTEIPEDCFCKCSALEEVKISRFNSTLAKIGLEAFSLCSSLKKIIIPDAVMEIPRYCFYGCSALEEVNISNNSTLAKLGELAFANCRSLKKINIADAVTEIPNHCFESCSSLEEVNISSNSLLTKIGEQAFIECKNLRTIFIPKGVRELSNYCFGNTGLQEIVFSSNSSLSTINMGAFAGCKDLIEIIIPDEIIEIATYCFYGCTSLRQIYFSSNSSLTSIGEQAFAYCSSLKTINLPKGISKLPYFCFSYSGIESFCCPENLTAIGSAFEGCGSLNSILFMQPTPPNMIRNLSNRIFIYVPQKNYDAYVEAGVDQYFKLIALNEEQVAEYKENGEVYGDGVNDYLAVTMDGKDFYNFKATLQNNYYETLELVRYIIRDAETMVAQTNSRYNGVTLEYGKQRSLTQSKQDDKQYVFEWYYMYDGKLCKKSSADVVEHPKFYQDKVAYSITGDSVELIGAMQDLELAVIPATMTWNVKDYTIVAVSENAFEQCNALKAVVDLNGNVKAEVLRTSAPVYVANANGNDKLKEFVSWKDNQFTYTGKTHKPAWMNNLSEFGVTAKADAQTTKADVGEYADSIAFSFTYQKQTFDAKIPCKYAITPVPLTAEVQNAQREYGQENPKFEVKYTGFVNGETAAVVTKAGEFATEATVKSDVGEYDITFSGAEAKNYSITSKSGMLTVTPATLTAKVNDAGRVYGDENPDFTYTLTGLVNGDKQEDVLTDKGQFMTTATKTSDVGQYTVICDGIEAKNYDVEVVPGTLTIEKATLIGRVNAATKTYGAENPQFTARFIGFRNGEDTNVLIHQGTFATQATAKSEVDEYEVTMSGAEAKNYTFEYEPGTLTVIKAVLTAEVQDVQRAYGAENPQFTAKYTGFVNGDTEAVLTNKGTFATEATKESPAGEYAITLAGVEAKNYAVTTIAGKLTVAIAKLTVKVNNAERVYGDENPEFTYTLTGLLNGDKQEDVLTSVGTFTTEATRMSAVGEYAVKCTGVKARNYEVEVVDGVLRVTPAQIIVRVNNAKRPYGEDNPQFTARYIGFRNSETDNVLTNKGVFTTSATKTSDVGEYEITATDAQAKNYTFEYEPGTLTIEQAEQQIVWSQELGDIAQFKQIELTATATSGLAVSYQVTQGSDVCSVVKVGKATYLDCFGTGDVTLSVWQEGNKNYYPTLRTYKQVKVVPTGIGDTEAGDYTVIAQRGQLIIGGLKDGDTLQVTDLAGRTVYRGEESTIYVTRGSYVVRIGQQTWKVLVK